MSVEWMLIRGSGLVAFLLLAGATIWGLVLSLGILPKAVKRLTFVHESLSIGALLATVVHMVALYMHDFIEFGVRDVLVPGAATWRPLAVAWGGMAFYGMIVVIVSFYVRTHISQRYWRLLHFASFGVFLSALIHGITAGTDTTEPVVFALYVAIAAMVLGLTAMRVSMMVGGASKARRTGHAGADGSAAPQREVAVSADA